MIIIASQICKEVRCSCDEWQNEMKWMGLRPLLCTYRLNLTRRTSWGWRGEWHDTALQTQDSKLEPWWSEAGHATSQSQRLPTIFNLYEWAEKKHFVSLNLEGQRGGGQTRDLRLSTQAVLTTWTRTPAVTNDSRYVGYTPNYNAIKKVFFIYD